MNILITGSTGFIGRALAKCLTKHGHAVTVLRRSPDKVAALCGPGVKAFGSLSQLKAEDSRVPRTVAAAITTLRTDHRHHAFLQQSPAIDAAGSFR